MEKQLVSAQDENSTLIKIFQLVCCPIPEPLQEDPKSQKPFLHSQTSKIN